jgi:hypothetical protein
MALSVQLKRSTGTTYYLTAEVVEHSVVRLPVQAALPEKNMIVIDLGIVQEQINIRGVVDSAGTKLSYRAAARDWYGDITDWRLGTGMPQLIINSSETYYGAIKSLNFRQEAAKLETVTDQGWEFDLVFLVFKKSDE